ncbi:hypothetical protein AB0469_07475 [Streptomyces sp. NPDC093801]|uniref:hypothetical protein n=1 Tax=Streptomyces sp. NPDC093801 TaxID=3155203 RepID=UPI00344EBC80
MSQNFQPPAPSSYTPAAAPAPARSGNVVLGILAAVVAGLVAAGVYGAIVKATHHEIGYAAVGVGALVGFAAGKAGGRNAVLPVVAALVSVAAVLAGQLFGIALDGADQLSESVVDVLTNRTSDVVESWKDNLDPLTFLFLAIGGYAAFQVGRKTAA